MKISLFFLVMLVCLALSKRWDGCETCLYVTTRFKQLRGLQALYAGEVCSLKKKFHAKSEQNSCFQVEREICDDVREEAGFIMESVCREIIEELYESSKKFADAQVRFFLRF